MLYFLAVMTVVRQTSCFFDPTLLNKQDVNKDGYLTQNEMHPPPSGGWSEFLHWSDGNGDGRLSLPEAQTALQKTLDLISSNPFDAGISLADKDSDGFLTQRELSSGGQQWNQFIQDFDFNQDGRLSVEEYSKGIANLGEELGLDQGVLPSKPIIILHPEEAATIEKVEQSQSQVKESQTKRTSSVYSDNTSISQKTTKSQINSLNQMKNSHNGFQNVNSQATTEKTSAAICRVSAISLIMIAMIAHAFL